MPYSKNRAASQNCHLLFTSTPLQLEIYAENAGASCPSTKTEAFIGVSSQEERDQWINAIKKVIYGLRGRSVMPLSDWNSYFAK